MNDPTRDARTVIARRVKSLSQLRPEYVAYELLAALDDAGFAVAARPVVPTTQSDIEGLASFLRPALNEDHTGQHFSHGSEDTATAIARYLDNNGWLFAHRSGAAGTASTEGDPLSPLGANPAAPPVVPTHEPTTEQVEAVARALGREWDSQWDAINEATRLMYRREARVALEALAVVAGGQPMSDYQKGYAAGVADARREILNTITYLPEFSNADGTWVGLIEKSAVLAAIPADQEDTDE